MKKRKILAAALIFASVWICAAKSTKGNVNDARQSFEAEPVVIPADFEENTRALYENWYLNNYSSFAKDSEVANAKSDPGATDQQIIDRLNSLGTVIDMPFNSIVRSCIERYTKKGRGMVSGLLGLATYYDPIFEQALEEEGLPLELKYLPIIESALQPNAVSRAGATGLWQLMLATGKGYGMEINSVIDERRDPYVSSKKAAKLLKDLYNTYGDWSLVIAAYNCGPGTVNKALRRAGGDPKDHDFWSIYNYLPSETRGYFPMFVAAAYVMNYHKEHGIYPSLPTKPLLTDTIGIPYRVNINQISKVLNIPADEVRLLNPQFRSDVIPGTAKKPYMLVLPQQQIHAYLMSEDKIRGYNRDQYDRRDRAEPGQKPADRAFAEVTVDEDDDDDNESALVDDLVADDDEIVNDTFISDSTTSSKSGVKSQRSDTGYHKVVAGESINTIAELYGVDADDLARWNNLSRKSIRVGQQLRTTPPPTAKIDKKTPAASSSRSETTASTSRNKDKDPESVRARNQARREKRQQESKNVKESGSQNVEQAAAPAASSRRNRSNKSTSSASQQQQAQAPAQQTSSQKKTSKKQNQQAQAQQTQKQQQQAANNKKKQQQQAAATAEAKKKEKETQEYLQNAAAGKYGKKAQKNAQAALRQQAADGSKNQKQGKQQQQAANAKNQKQTKQQQAAAAKQKQQAQAPAQHVVKSGESLSKIAQKQGTTVEALRKANPNIKGDLIKPDQKINIPAKTPAKAAKNSSKGNQKGAAAAQQQKPAKGKGKKK